VLDTVVLPVGSLSALLYIDMITWEYHASVIQFCQLEEFQAWQRTWVCPHPEYRWLNDHSESWHSSMTPREQLATRWLSRIPYFLLSTLEIADHPCVDLGCGGNELKWSEPNIWGVDPRNPQAAETLTPDWYITHWGRWHRVFSVNALHFHPVTEIADSVGKAAGLLVPGGRAVIALNRMRIQERDPAYSDESLRAALETVPYLTRAVWHTEPQDASLDGNVWLWLQRSE